MEQHPTPRERPSLQILAETLGFVVAANALGAGAGIVAGGGGESEWYRSLEKPSFAPPPWVFGPVWTVLYSMMGVALSILWRARRDTPAANPAIRLFTIQFVLNLCWSFIFFRLQNPRAALIEILVLNLAILLTIRASWRVSRTAALLLVPYLMWTAFATVLNAAFWRLNS